MHFRRPGNQALHYHWIDSLCIIQESVEDWLAESVMMGKVYRNATLCIAASGLENAEGGLFRTRDPVNTSSYRFDLAGISQSRSY
jgi:hypothetical protein